MKHVKKFENFDLGHRFSHEEEEGELQPLELEGGYEEEEGEELEGEEECAPCKDEEGEGDEDELRLERVVSFRQFEAKKAKPDFLDLDKDGDKKESMKKAAKDAKAKKDDKKDSKEDDKKEDKKEEKGGKGLTAAQKKLPEGLRKAIEAKKKK